MSKLTRILGRWFPSTVRPPVIAPRQRGFHAAGSGGRWSPANFLSAPAGELHNARGIVTPRIAGLVVNNPHAANAVNQIATSLIGDGPSARSKHQSATARLAIEAGWSRWWAQCDADGVSADLGHFVTRAVRSLVVTGEILVLMTTDPRTALLLRLLNPEQLDATKNVEDLESGGRIIAGVEFDGDSRICAYWIRPDRPDLPFAMALEAVRFDAVDVLHIFDPVFAGQVRGISPLTPVATRLAELDRIEDNLSAQIAVASQFGLVFTSPTPDTVFDGGDSDTQDPKFPTMEAGASIVAPPGYEVTAVQPPQSESSVAFTKHLLRSIAAGLGVPYELLAGDLEAVNYSSAKLGHESFRRRCDTMRRTLLVPKFFAPVWRRCLTLEVLAGRLDVPGFFADYEAALDAEFLWTAWASLDPLKDAEATALNINAGIQSRYESIAARGRDPAEVLAEIERDAAAAQPRPVPKTSTTVNPDA